MVQLNPEYRATAPAASSAASPTPSSSPLTASSPVSFPAPLRMPATRQQTAGPDSGAAGNGGAAGGHDDGQYYMPASALGRRTRDMDHAASAGRFGREAYDGARIYLFSSSSGGCGTTATAAMFAYHLMQEGQRVVLLDLDLSRGGMDILLGLEQDEGLRWSGIDAPLGMIDGPALIREMLQWDGCPVLSADTWCAAPHQWWEISAVISAVCTQADSVICDCSTNTAIIRGLQAYCDGTGTSSSQAQDWLHIWEAVGNRKNVSVVFLAELTVLGLIRTKTAVDRFSAHTYALQPDIIGVSPGIGKTARRGMFSAGRASGVRGAVSVEQASSLLRSDVLGPLHRIRTVDISIREGRGIEDIPGAYRPIFETLSRKTLQHWYPDTGSRGDADGHTDGSADDDAAGSRYSPDPNSVSGGNRADGSGYSPAQGGRK